MSETAFKPNAAVDVITKALDDFLRDKRLKLTPQQYSRLKKLLMVRLLEEEMSYSNAYGHLSDIVEYRKEYEIDANAPDEAEEEMIRIIGAADAQEVEVVVESQRFRTLFFITICLLLFIGMSTAIFKTVQHFKAETIKMASVISSEQEEEIKTLVEQLVTLEKSQGRDITSNAIYNEIKKLESVTASGEVTSYKKFNQSQHAAAVQYLNARLTKVSATP